MEAAELYNPATGTWTTMESQQANCIYHSMALLLPDGRVISAERAKMRCCRRNDSGSEYPDNVSI